MAYAQTTDVEWGNIPEPGNVQFWLDKGAEEIDSKIGHLYATPVLLNPGDSTQRGGYLLLKRINAWLAMGRAIMAIAAGGEDAQLHALAKYYVDESSLALKAIVHGEITLNGATPSSPDIDIQNGPQITNVDSSSLVEGFGSAFGDPAKTTLARPRSIYPGAPPYIGTPYTW